MRAAFPPSGEIRRPRCALPAPILRYHSNSPAKETNRFIIWRSTLSASPAKMTRRWQLFSPTPPPRLRHSLPFPPRSLPRLSHHLHLSLSVIPLSSTLLPRIANHLHPPHPSSAFPPPPSPLLLRLRLPFFPTRPVVRGGIARYACSG